MKSQYAHIFGTPKRGYTLRITTTPDLTTMVKEEWHATKPSAKASAKKQNLVAWNY